MVQPSIASAAAAAAANKDRSRYELQFYKTRTCSFFQKGKCTRGEKCKYAHGDRELKERPDLTFTSLCREFVATGACNDPTCSFAHNPGQLRATGKFYKTSLCKFHLQGRCRLGEECRHAHGVEELQQLPESATKVRMMAPPGLEKEGPSQNMAAAAMLLTAAATGAQLGPMSTPWPTSELLMGRHMDQPAFVPMGQDPPLSLLAAQFGTHFELPKDNFVLPSLAQAYSGPLKSSSSWTTAHSSASSTSSTISAEDLEPAHVNLPSDWLTTI
ncbi:unnamed protein product [Effrenium voratum]|uniref:C3H1-type domain-containing protein n=1 Tax=Effrenium voratum TaxID=2562239 RepID=A0AA36ICH7_9DINO|nr:unnamed protein product [Effrenium voratum]|eukprot:CAMPEP_0181457640 /NCGR_PEP_ID=MMETSP1110-20121109/31890_1 /TAXON_ID=174948 /ORGANISM="Symbiodinium sp., Strain CCMP421" /LENGTH=271 /DNA_ID=CAMNT_0023582087 /DNA_START=55 /DNA_END=870 /DNA_ORIENTATION=+